MSSKQIYDLSGKFQEAFDFFNEQLFRNRLPQVIITTQRHRGAYGVFCPESYIQRSFDEDGNMLVPEYQVHEISIMPDNMYGRSDREVLSTLVHEMCHLQQQEQGKPSRNGYHNKQWGDYMRAVGLEPSSYGKNDSRNPELPEEQKEKYGEGVATGQKVSHFIIPNASFDKACAKLLDSGFTLDLQQAPRLIEKAKKNKLKYICPQCGINAWAKPGVKLACGECMIQMDCEEAED